MRLARQLPAALAVAVLALACLTGIVFVGPAAHAAPGSDQPAVGGPALASHGMVVDSDPGAPPVPADLTASSWLVADLDSGAVLAARDPHGRYLPASTLKTLTALTLIPLLDPDTVVRPTYDDIAVDGSKVGLVDTMGYPVRQLFTAMLVVSANDAADTLATAAGGIPKTLALMNAEAQKLRAYDTHAGTPSGLDAPGQTSSAYDLALIARAAMALPDFRSYVAIVHSAVSAPAGKTIDIYTHDRLLTNYPGAIGIKNGYTVAAQATFVGAATRNGHTLVVTLMHAAPSVWKEAERLLDWGFAAIGHVQPVGQLVDPQPDRTRATAALHAAPVRTSAAAQSGGGLGALPIGLGVSAVVLLIGSWLRRSATRRRRRYSLPPL
ncbi:MAG TPA: hypothetical protein VFJ21_06855 [Mycobacteriales bacterium]|jgi:D-alanyl-D-alanine carboxypeptidase (penicillin-binding protein 5/6)|nr:hypothetical protein [Mycobacteriales bacterium]